VEGNELLTGLAGAVLIVVLAVLGLSILRIGPLISVLAIATGLGTGVILALIALPSCGAWSHYFSVR
jgi:hypothetical protein